MGKPSRSSIWGSLASLTLLSVTVLALSGSAGLAQIDELFRKLMRGDAGSSEAAQFRPCVTQTWAEAARRGVSSQSFGQATEHLEPDLHIMDLLDAQPEFTKSVWDYLDLLVSDAR